MLLVFLSCKCAANEIARAVLIDFAGFDKFLRVILSFHRPILFFRSQSINSLNQKYVHRFTFMCIWTDSHKWHHYRFEGKMDVVECFWSNKWGHFCRRGCTYIPQNKYDKWVLISTPDLPRNLWSKIPFRFVWLKRSLFNWIAPIAHAQTDGIQSENSACL